MPHRSSVRYCLEHPVSLLHHHQGSARPVLFMLIAANICLQVLVRVFFRLEFRPGAIKIILPYLAERPNQRAKGQVLAELVYGQGATPRHLSGGLGFVHQDGPDTVRPPQLALLGYSQRRRARLGVRDVRGHGKDQAQAGERVTVRRRLVSSRGSSSGASALGAKSWENPVSYYP